MPEVIEIKSNEEIREESEDVLTYDKKQPNEAENAAENQEVKSFSQELNEAEVAEKNLALNTSRQEFNEADNAVEDQELKIASTRSADIIFLSRFSHEEEEQQSEEHKSLGGEDSTSVTLSSMDMEWQKFHSDNYQKQIEEKDFFEQIKNLPTIDEISISSLLTDEQEQELDKSTTTQAYEEEEAEEEQGTQTEEFTAKDESETLSTDLDFDFDLEDSIAEKQIMAKSSLKDDDDNVLDTFMEMVKPTKAIVIKTDTIDYDEIQRMQKLNRDIHAYLRSIIDAVVQVTEHVEPEVVVRKNLDKVQAYRAIAGIMENLQQELKAFKFLKSKCVMYYRRTKALDKFTPENVEKLPALMETYKETLSKLDRLLGQQKFEIEKIEAENAQTQALAVVEELNTKAIIENLELLLKQTFGMRNSAVLNKMVDNAIDDMKNLREKIFTKRLKLIEHQHNKAVIGEKMEKLQRITENLRLSDYERMQVQQHTLEDKFEDQNERLVRMKARFNMLNHDLVHIRGKQSLMYCSMQAQLQQFNAVDEEKQNIRAYIHQLKLQNLSLKRQIVEKSIESGLIDKPALLIDYDQTLERGEALKETVKELKMEIQMLEHKISNVLRNTEVCKH